MYIEDSLKNRLLNCCIYIEFSVFSADIFRKILKILVPSSGNSRFVF